MGVEQCGTGPGVVVKVACVFMRGAGADMDVCPPPHPHSRLVSGSLCLTAGDPALS